MADFSLGNWWDRVFGFQGMNAFEKPPQPQDEVLYPDNRARLDWRGSPSNPGKIGEKLDPNAIGIFGRPNPTGFRDRMPYVNTDEGDRLTRELWRRHEAGQLGDPRAYEGMMDPTSPYTEEDVQKELRGRAGSYLTRISAGAAPPSGTFGEYEGEPIPNTAPPRGTFGEFEGEPIPNTEPTEYGFLQDYIRQHMMRPPTYKEGDIIPGGEHSNSAIDESMVIKPGPGRTADENEIDRTWHRERDFQRISDMRGAAPPQQENYLSGPVTSARERLNPLESFIMDKLENSRDVGFDARNNFPHDQLVDMIMRKYGLAESGRRNAEDYAAELRLFSNPQDYRNFEPQEGIGRGDQTPFEEIRRRRIESERYQPISDVRPQDRDTMFRRPPLASGILSPPSTSGFRPLIDLQGDMSMNRKFQRSPLNLQGMYRRTFPF